MFTIEIKVLHPICGCSKFNLGWGLDQEGIFVECETCDARLVRNKQKLNAYVVAERGLYPDGVATKDNVLKLVEE